jgi:organic hydroperoxide reductase OsmC/OhrA
MSEYSATIRWERGDQDFLSNQYSRGHQWEFDGGTVVPASASPHNVPLPMSIERNVDPEEAFVAALSSCHMLFFLSIAAKKRVVVDAYVDKALGFMEQNADGRMAITKVILHPEIKFSGKKIPSKKQVGKIHHLSHENCFIANSVKTEVVIEIV